MEDECYISMTPGGYEIQKGGLPDFHQMKHARMGVKDMVNGGCLLTAQSIWVALMHADLGPF